MRLGYLRSWSERSDQNQFTINILIVYLPVDKYGHNQNVNKRQENKSILEPGINETSETLIMYLF
jgi:hypothetical protein